MTWERLDAMGGAQWPCWDEEHPGTQYLHARLWEDDPEERLRPAPFSVVLDEPPVDELTDEYPIRLDNRSAARLVQHRGADGRVHVPAPASRGDRALA